MGGSYFARLAAITVAAAIPYALLGLILPSLWNVYTLGYYAMAMAAWVARTPRQAHCVALAMWAYAGFLGSRLVLDPTDLPVWVLTGFTLTAATITGLYALRLSRATEPTRAWLRLSNGREAPLELVAYVNEDTHRMHWHAFSAAGPILLADQDYQVHVESGNRTARIDLYVEVDPDGSRWCPPLLADETR
jgi:hypothetical protein